MSLVGQRGVSPVGLGPDDSGTVPALKAERRGPQPARQFCRNHAGVLPATGSSLCGRGLDPWAGSSTRAPAQARLFNVRFFGRRKTEGQAEEWCPELESNQHGILSHKILSLARLPIPPPGQRGGSLAAVAAKSITGPCFSALNSGLRAPGGLHPPRRLASAHPLSGDRGKVATPSAAHGRLRARTLPEACRAVSKPYSGAAAGNPWRTFCAFTLSGASLAKCRRSTGAPWQS